MKNFNYIQLVTKLVLYLFLIFFALKLLCITIKISLYSYNLFDLIEYLVRWWMSTDNKNLRIQFSRQNGIHRRRINFLSTAPIFI